MVQGSTATQRVSILIDAWGICSCQAQHLHARACCREIGSSVQMLGLFNMLNRPQLDHRIPQLPCFAGQSTAEPVAIDQHPVLTPATRESH